MRIRSVMKTQVVSIPAGARVEEAMRLMIDRHVGLLPVVDGDGRLLGEVRLDDLVDKCLPAFVDMVKDFDFVNDFGAGESEPLEGYLKRASVSDILRAALSVDQDSGLLRAHAFMRQHELHDVPVVDEEGRLVGIASWVDVGIGFLVGSLATDN